ncbi:PH domain-containing protein [Dokdonella soli]|uniref:Bacterial Pleckstrin homology domain-containing protein n=1 Tax=Dokdonella soli TaxID=529810 RepID=A0ABN1J0K8_9GAMM
MSIEDDAPVFFGVRYGRLLKIMTTVAGLILLVVPGIGLVTGRHEPFALAGMVGLPLAILVTTFLFAVRGYEVAASGVYVARPIGPKRIAARITDIAADDSALEGAIRTFGNGGLFSFNGWFRLRKYGSCRLWVTDLDCLVVMRGDSGCVVVSPAQRERFVTTVRKRLGGAS